MNKRAILLVCAVLAAASSLATCQNSPSFNLLDWSLLESGWDANIEETKKALESIGPMEKDDLSGIKNKILELLKNPHIPDHHRSVFSDLDNLIKMPKLPTEDLTRRVMEICFILKDPKYTELNWFVNFLHTCGWAKFGYGMEVAVKELSKDGSQENEEAKRMLDRLFGVHSYDDDVSLEMLRKFKVWGYEVERAMRIIGGFDGSREEDLQRLLLLISQQCEKLRKGREFHFNVISLAAAFRFHLENMPLKVGVLREYSRLCAKVARDGTKITLGEKNAPQTPDLETN